MENKPTTTGLLCTLAKDGQNDISLLVHSASPEGGAPYWVVEDGRRSFFGGYDPSMTLEKMLALQIQQHHPGYVVKDQLEIKFVKRE